MTVAKKRFSLRPDVIIVNFDPTFLPFPISHNGQPYTTTTNTDDSGRLAMFSSVLLAMVPGLRARGRPALGEHPRQTEELEAR